MFKLVVRPDGHAILTTEHALDEQEMHKVRTLFHQWKQGHEALLLAQTKVVQVVDVELDLTIDVSDADPD